MDSKKLVCIIPARGGSKGIKDKNLQEIRGESLLSIAIKTYRESKYVEDVYVSSDSKEILNEARKYGAIPIQRKLEYATDLSSSESVIHSFLLDDYKGDCQDVIFAQCTSPFIHTNDVNKAILSYHENKFDSLFSASIHKGFIWKKDINNNCYGINHNSNKQRVRRQDLDEEYIENGGFYIFNKSSFIREHNRFIGKIGCHLIQGTQVEIDTHEDLEFARFFSNKISKNKTKYKTLILDFDGVLTDNKVSTYKSGEEKVVCSKADSLAISRLKDSHINVFILTSEDNLVVDIRAKKLNLEVYRSKHNKKDKIFEILNLKNLNIKESIFIGNDLNDLDVFRSDIFCCCPNDASNSIKDISDFVSSKDGGNGAIREVSEIFFGLN